MSEFQDLNREYQELTGQDLFLYATQPNPKSTTYYIFTDRNFTNRGNALEYLRLKLDGARQASEAARAANAGDTTKAGIRQPSGGKRVNAANNLDA